MLPMRDGIKLQTIIYFPPELKKKTGVIYIRSPYTRTTEMAYHSYPQALTHNVVTVMQACLGTGWSEGVFDPAESMEYECRDAEDTFNWLKTQSWYNGRCVMTGASYPGWVQWCAMMVKGGNLAGVTPRVAPLYGCTGSARPGGGVSLSFTENWMLSMHHRRKYGYGNVPDYEKMQIVRKLPVIDADKHAAYPELAPIRKFFKKALTPGNALASPPQNLARHIAMAHTIFNVAVAIILLPAIGLLAKLCNLLIPIRDTVKVNMLAPELLNTPSVALKQSSAVIKIMVEDAFGGKQRRHGSKVITLSHAQGVEPSP